MLAVTALGAACTLGRPALPADALRPDVAKPLAAAQELYRAHKYRDALGKIAQAAAVPNRTPYETYMVEEMRGAAAMAAGDTGTAAQAYETVLNAGRLSGEDEQRTTAALAGSSDWFERGFVTYTNEAKSQLLGVDPALFGRVGAVSEEVARAMVQGALQCAPVQLAVAVTGIAGPGGAVPGKPVGTVWLAWGTAQGVQAQRLQLPGHRDAVRGATVTAALQRLLQVAQAAGDVKAPAP